MCELEYLSLMQEMEDKMKTFSGVDLNFKPYRNEFESMRLYCNPQSEKMSMNWLRDLETKENMEFGWKDNSEKVLESKVLRQKGNGLFAKGDKQNILGACRLYTDAIYAALDTKGDELALGFANRAIGLQSFGYYQQAYDDCVCALKYGYPKPMHHKIIIRQAYCSIKMQDVSKAEKHLSELKAATINDNFSKELCKLLKAFDELKYEMANKENSSDLVEECSLNRETQEIIITEHGRSMRAKCNISKNQLIFTERTSAFVPVGDTHRICHNCCTSSFIPIPCLHCRGRVNYCSLKCQNDHISIHMYECAAYRYKFFDHIGVGHLALRIILDNGVFSILDELKLDNKTSDVWCKLIEGGDVWKNNTIQYAESLRMITHLNKMSYIEILLCTEGAHHLLIYLKCYTKYFEILKAANNNIDWELLVGSLILRHIGQLMSNGHSIQRIIPRPLSQYNTPFHMLNENVWSSPWHLKLGYLHFFNHCDCVASFNLTYANLCNHSCVQYIQPKFSGRFISAYALRDIKKGQEITNCYYLDCRNSKRVERRENLLTTYYFECQCEDCIQTDKEELEFNQFHQYRCDNTKCRQIFIPTTDKNFILNFWKSDISNDENLFCTICGHKQSLKWYYESKNLMTEIVKANVRRHLYKIFKDSEKYLVGLNEARCVMARILVQEWFHLTTSIDYTCNDKDYHDLVDMLKFILTVTSKQSSVNSIRYVVEMVYLWDIMAKRKYKCTKTEMEEMLWAITIISDDLKMIFLNYYNDYLKNYLNL